MAEAARVRQTVKGLLASTPAYSQLPPAKKRQIVHDMVRVAAYMADPHGLVSIEARQPVLSRRSTRRSVSSAASRRSAMLLRAAQDGKLYLRLEIGALEHEVFCVLFLDAQHRIIALKQMFRGTVTQTSVYPREVVKEALAVNAAAVVLAHNHPLC
jgi:hypothetical protein